MPAPHPCAAALAQQLLASVSDASTIDRDRHARAIAEFVCETREKQLPAEYRLAR